MPRFPKLNLRRVKPMRNTTTFPLVKPNPKPPTKPQTPNQPSTPTTPNPLHPGPGVTPSPKSSQTRSLVPQRNVPQRNKRSLVPQRNK